MDAKVYFERRAVDDDELREAIPELLKVIEDLRPLRQSERQTDDYLNKWLRSKRKEYVYLPLPNGEIAECENRDMDMTLFYRFNEWLFSYFHKLYTEKTGKTIGYAYALDTLTVYYNRFMSDRFKVPYEKSVDRPNTDIDDVAEAIEAEDSAYILQTDPLAIEDEYTKGSEVIRCGMQELKIIYCALNRTSITVSSKDPKRFSPYPLSVINDLRRIMQHHENNPDECIHFIRNKYLMNYSISTIFIECLLLVVDGDSDFMFLFRQQAMWRVRDNKVRQDFALKLDNARKDSLSGTVQSIPAAGIQSTQQQVPLPNATVGGIDTDKPQRYPFTLTKETEVKIIKNYNFWTDTKAKNKNNNAYKNIFEDFTLQYFLEMVCAADFSSLKTTGCKDRIKNNIVILLQIMGNEWGIMAAESLNTTLEECQKRTDYAEYEQLKNLYK